MSALDDILNPLLAKYSQAEIARVAGINTNYLNSLVAGRRKPGAATLGKLRRAGPHLKHGQNRRSADLSIKYRFALVVAAFALRLDPVMVQASLPAAKQAANKEWRNASFARWIAWYLLNSSFGLSQAEVARAAGVTKQAVSLAMRQITEKRDETEFDKLLFHLDQCLGLDPLL
jgi:transcriptional regulator with XRE-family HTH domain